MITRPSCRRAVRCARKPTRISRIAGLVLAAGIALASVVGPTTAVAEEIVTPQNYYQEPKNVVPPPITQAQAIAHVRQNYRGRVLSFRPYQHGYRFRIDMKGRVKTVDVDGNTLRDK